MTETTYDDLPPQGHEGADPLDLPALLDQWREEQPIRRISVVGGGSAWLVTRYQDIRDGLGDQRLSADRNRPGFPHLRIDEPPMPNGTFNHYDEPDHNRVRRMLAKAFTPRSVEALEPAIGRIVDELLDSLAELPRPVGFHEHFALALPSLVMCEVLGVPYADREVFQKNTQDILDIGRSGADVTRAFEEMLSWLEEFLEAKGRDPQDDLMSEIAVRRVATGEIAKDEAVGAISMLLLAGHETTANMLSLGVLSLLRAPDQLRRLRTDPGVVPGAVEEILRHVPFLQTGLRRIATEDVEIGGVTIRRGEGVVLAIHAGNRDPRVFDDPDRLDLGREIRNHLAFSHGIHQCIGATLARAELRIALPAVFARFPGLRIAVPDAEIPYRPNTLFLTLDDLPVTW
ncbi:MULTISPECIES: cytochrome P450 [unclassified Streptomyces]|uniref:cytochrome P450 n=1 Tax=unclassified Streptomyces TaxID=2593676 RepID=UPI001905ABD0|nr:cytochrome P450 [Streptomyces sp. HSG2]